MYIRKEVIIKIEEEEGKKKTARENYSMAYRGFVEECCKSGISDQVFVVFDGKLQRLALEMRVLD